MNRRRMSLANQQKVDEKAEKFHTRYDSTNPESLEMKSVSMW